MFTLDQLQDYCSNAKSEILEALVENQETLIDDYEINTPLKMAHFLAQTSHESGGFRVMTENLNYSAGGLNKVFPKYFINAGRNANQYARNPEAIANIVYASRMGNGSTSSGDGWKYRGRGLIQLTGKFNYQKYAEDNDMSLQEAVDYLSTTDGAVDSAGWFWWKNGCNSLAAKNDIVAVTKRINGGTHGLDDRRKRFNLFKEMLDI